MVRNERVHKKPVKKQFKEDKLKANETKICEFNEISLKKEIKEKPIVNTFKEDLQQDCTKEDQDLFMQEIQKEIREIQKILTSLKLHDYKSKEEVQKLQQRLDKLFNQIEK